jgi:hypothetical protein
MPISIGADLIFLVATIVLLKVGEPRIMSRQGFQAGNGARTKPSVDPEIVEITVPLEIAGRDWLAGDRLAGYGMHYRH